MADALSFSLVSPERELYAGDVSHVVLPGQEGQFQVGPGHAPLMATLSPGRLMVVTAGGQKGFFVRGGFADVTSRGLTVLAELAIPEDELTNTVISEQREWAEGVKKDEESSPEQVIDAQRAEEALNA